ncbi:hypothetical protein J2Z81_002831 [Virgibacillus campisalis]|uniref:Transposase n=1 Tax=Virgibacillus alimentarius TaxID=698769 RepID=A0ABS4SBF8_9BACI|nr:hypothetical protein [Virgibacillus alimentarius]
MLTPNLCDSDHLYIYIDNVIIPLTESDQIDLLFDLNKV